MNRRKIEMIETALGKDLKLSWGTHIVYVPRVRHTITKYVHHRINSWIKRSNKYLW